MARLRSIITAIVFIALVILALRFVHPLALFLVALIGLIVLFILIDAFGNRILFKMALRNTARRKSVTALVLGGLMVGTAIIAASLVVGDTLDNIVVGEVAKDYGAVDFFVSGPGTNNNGYYNYSQVAPVQGQVKNLSFVTGAEW